MTKAYDKRPDAGLDARGGGRASPPASSPAVKIEGPFEDVARLPPRVAALREKILTACARRDVEALAVPIQWAETPPIFSRGPDRPKTFAQIVDFLRARSFDKRGVEMVDVMRAVFESSFVKETNGAFESYVWPAAALAPAEAMEGEALARRYATVRFADLGLVDAAGRPLMHKAGVGADGTWHYFAPNEAAGAPLPRR
jgi:hypothetical protein